MHPDPNTPRFYGFVVQIDGRALRPRVNDCPENFNLLR